MTTRGFPHSEFKSRVARAQRAMQSIGLDALLLTTHPDIYYFTGYLTRFWESPTRPWFLIVPRDGDPIAVIPSIGAPLMAATWVADIRTWPSPEPRDDGVSLLADALSETVIDGRIGIPDGHETHLRMPLAGFEQLKQRLPRISFEGDGDIVRRMRMVKSELEVEKIARACRIAGRAFLRTGEIARAGTPLEDVYRQFQVLCLAEGADWVPYLAMGAGAAGYRDVISPAPSRALVQGDVLMLDTGLVWDGYFCDFDRNFAVGTPAGDVGAAHTLLIEATRAGFESLRAGQRACDVFQAMDQSLKRAGGQVVPGRLGHGLGIELTEKPSLLAGDMTELEAGMVLTLEPAIFTRDGCMLVHEENVVVTENGAGYLSEPAGLELACLD